MRLVEIPTLGAVLKEIPVGKRSLNAKETASVSEARLEARSDPAPMSSAGPMSSRVEQKNLRLCLPGFAYPPEGVSFLVPQESEQATRIHRGSAQIPPKRPLSIIDGTFSGHTSRLGTPWLLAVPEHAPGASAVLAARVLCVVGRVAGRARDRLAIRQPSTSNQRRQNPVHP